MTLMRMPPSRGVLYTAIGFFAGAIAPSISLIPVLQSGFLDITTVDLFSTWPHFLLAGMPIAGAAIAWNIASVEQRLRRRNTGMAIHFRRLTATR